MRVESSGDNFSSRSRVATTISVVSIDPVSNQKVTQVSLGLCRQILSVISGSSYASADIAKRLWNGSVASGLMGSRSGFGPFDWRNGRQSTLPIQMKLSFVSIMCRRGNS